MKTEHCYVCGSAMQPLFRLRLLARYDVQYYRCVECGYCRTEHPYWLDEAYSSAIARADTGILQRNWSLSAKLACLLYYCMDRQGVYLDVAGGYGILTRLMRDYGFDYYWEDKYCENLLARGFESTHAPAAFTAMSAFEVIEHTIDPLEFVAETMRKHACRTLLFSTMTYAGAAPAADWAYLSPATGQHISFFHRRTLQRIADRLGLRFCSSSGMHLLCEGEPKKSWLYPVLSSPLAWGWAQYVRVRMGSRVLPDNQRMLMAGSDKAR